MVRAGLRTQVNVGTVGEECEVSEATCNCTYCSCILSSPFWMHSVRHFPLLLLCVHVWSCDHVHNYVCN